MISQHLSVTVLSVDIDSECARQQQGRVDAVSLVWTLAWPCLTQVRVNIVRQFQRKQDPKSEIVVLGCAIQINIHYFGPLYFHIFITSESQASVFPYKFSRGAVNIHIHYLGPPGGLFLY